MQRLAIGRSSLRTIVPVSLFAMLASACGSGDSSSAPANSNPPTPPPPTSPVTGDPTIAQSVWESGLNLPWDMAFVSDGTLFYTEKCRGLSVRRLDGTKQRLFGTTGSAVLANDLVCTGQGGANGVAVDPNFAVNRYVYVYMASSLGGPTTNRVVRLVVDGAFTTVSGRTDIVTDIPFKVVANSAGGAGAHNGGRLRFGPDGYLYVGTGDNHNGPLPQDLTLLGGKILRITRDGAAAPGNNTPSGGNARIYTYGHRNVQGLAFRPTTSQPFSCEHGPGHTDEVTPLVAGGNGGWAPAPQIGVVCGDNYCGYTSNRPDGQPTRMTDIERFANAMQPSWTNDGFSRGMGPCTFLSGTQWKGWEGRLVVGIMGEQQVKLLSLDANGLTTLAQNFPGVPATARPRSVVQGPDGLLYIATDSGEIWRVTPN